MWLRWGLQRGCERSECSSDTYELEYSSYVMILAYELAYNFDVMSLAYRTLCLIIHITYMIRIRAKLRCWFIIPLGLPMSYACRSIGSESRGDIGSFFIHEHGPWVYAPRLRGRRHVVIALSIPYNLPRSSIRIGVHKVSRPGWKTSAQRSPHPSYT
jgi:hypothetical protein